MKIFHEKFSLANVATKTDKGTNIAKSVIEYINEQYDPAMSWKDAEYCVKKWGKPFALKGVMSVEDAKRAIDIGCTAIMIAVHPMSIALLASSTDITPLSAKGLPHFFTQYSASFQLIAGSYCSLIYSITDLAIFVPLSVLVATFANENFS